MNTLGVSGMMFQCVFEGSLSMQDTEIERRPYHKNCNCALHKSKGGVCSNACQQRNISFSKKQLWADGSLCMSTATSNSLLLSSLYQETRRCPELETEKVSMRLLPQHVDNRWSCYNMDELEEERFGTENQI